MEHSIPKVKLTQKQRIWISEIANSYLNDKLPDDTCILIKHQEELSDFEPYKIDETLFSCGREVNLYGIYCLNDKHELVITINKIIRYIQNSFKIRKEFPSPFSIVFTAEELLEKAKINKIEPIRASLKLICHFPHFCDSATGPAKGGFGHSSIVIKSFDTVKRYLNYDSIASLIIEFLKSRKPSLLRKTTKQKVLKKKCPACPKYFYTANRKKKYCNDACKEKFYRNYKTAH